MSVVLVVNSGSSSFKYQLLDMATESVLAIGLVERIGEPATATGAGASRRTRSRPPLSPRSMVPRRR